MFRGEAATVQESQAAGRLRLVLRRLPAVAAAQRVRSRRAPVVRFAGKRVARCDPCSLPVAPGRHGCVVARSRCGNAPGTGIARNVHLVAALRAAIRATLLLPRRAQNRAFRVVYAIRPLCIRGGPARRAPRRVRCRGAAPTRFQSLGAVSTTRSLVGGVSSCSRTAASSFWAASGCSCNQLRAFSLPCPIR